MLVDLSKAKAGDTVKLRCGGSTPIVKITSNGGTYTVQYQGRWSNLHRQDGRRVATTSEAFNGKTPHETPFDITEVIPAPVQFDWSTVARGMCFKDGTGVRFWWVGKSYKEHDFYIEDADGGIWRQHGTQHLTRAPEHDVEGE